MEPLRQQAPPGAQHQNGREQKNLEQFSTSQADSRVCRF